MLLDARPTRAISTVAVVAVVFAGLLGCGPIGPFAGGRLSGKVGPAVVSDWSSVGELQTANLETRPSDPHSVNVWFASIDENLYVPSSMIRGPKDPLERSWVAHVIEDPRVRIRLGDTVHERIAVRVADQAQGRSEYEAARAALVAKYELAPEDLDAERTIWIFRLDARTD